ncbi:MAG: HTTM domain-containing protein [Gaiellaceae bacterium]
MKERARELLSIWNGIWFEPVSTAPLAVFRIAFGLVSLGWALSLLPEISAFFTKGSILPHQPNYSGKLSGAWGLLGIFHSEGAAIGLVTLMIIASICLTLGLFSQLAAAVVFLALLSFQRRNPFVVNSGDVLMRVLAFYLIFAPTSAALSLDRFLRHRKDFWRFPARAPWAMRLLQIQFSAVYLFAVWAKVRGTTWNNGTAVSFAFRITDIARFPVPSFITHSLLISNLLTFGTLAVELSLALLVWNRKLRPWILLAGLGLHLGIEYAIRVCFYGLAILSLYLIWIPSERIETAMVALRSRLARGPGAKLASATAPSARA